jgi:hypothetical protein
MSATKPHSHSKGASYDSLVSTHDRRHEGSTVTNEAGAFNRAKSFCASTDSMLARSSTPPIVTVTLVRQFLFVGQIKLIGTDLLRTQEFRRLAEIACEQRNLLHIRPLSVWREIANLHILAHPFSKMCHGKLSLCVMKSGWTLLLLARIIELFRNKGRKWMRMEVLKPDLVLLEYREAV